MVKHDSHSGVVPSVVLLEFQYYFFLYSTTIKPKSIFPHNPFNPNYIQSEIFGSGPSVRGTSHSACKSNCRNPLRFLACDHDDEPVVILHAAHEKMAFSPANIRKVVGVSCLQPISAEKVPFLVMFQVS